jgi:hypothetical protein
MHEEEGRITRASFEKNLAAKRTDTKFTADMTPLLAHGRTWSFDGGFDAVLQKLVRLLP